MADPTFAAGAPGAGVSSEAAAMLNNFWPNTTNEIRALKHDHFKTQELPLARIKKIMKLDDDVKMISAEAPVLFAKAAEVFISELSLRSWIHTEDNKRRTLQRNDIAMAISKFDQFDFLIDIVPREEQKPPKRPDDAMRTPVLPDQIQYYLQLAQQQAQQQAGQGANPTPTPPTVQVQQPTAPTTQIQLPGGQVLQQPVQITQPVTQQPTAATTQSQVITIQPPHQQQQQQQTTGQPQVQVQQVQQVQQQPATQVFQQVFTPSGEVQNVPIQLTPQQLQAIQMQLQGKGGNQPIIIQQNSTAQPAQTLTQSDQFSNQGVFQVQQIQGSGQPVYIQQTDGTNGDS